MHKKNADTGPAARRGICDAKEGGLRHEQASLQPEWRKSAAASEDLPSDRAGNPRSNSSGTMRLSATIVYQSAVRASSPKHKSGAHGEACELADSRSNGFRNCSGSRRSGHDPAAGRESGSNRRRPECCLEFSRTVEMNERNKIKILLRSPSQRKPLACSPANAYGRTAGSSHEETTFSMRAIVVCSLSILWIYRFI